MSTEPAVADRSRTRRTVDVTDAALTEVRDYVDGDGAYLERRGEQTYLVVGE